MRLNCYRARIYRPFKEPRNRFPAWRNRFLKWFPELHKRLQIRALIRKSHVIFPQKFWNLLLISCCDPSLGVRGLHQRLCLQDFFTLSSAEIFIHLLQHWFIAAPQIQLWRMTMMSISEVVTVALAVKYSNESARSHLLIKEIFFLMPGPLMWTQIL